MDDEKGENADVVAPVQAETPVIPLVLHQGEKLVPGPDGVLETRVPLPDDMARMTALDQELASTYHQVARLEIQIQDLDQQKRLLVAQAKNTQAAMTVEAEKAALRVGIDPKYTSQNWKLDLAARIFKRVL